MGGLKALLVLHSPLLYLQAADKLCMCLRREVSKGDGDGVEVGAVQAGVMGQGEQH